MVRISFLGACREIGRSAVLLEAENSDTTVLLEYGVKMENKNDNFPRHVSARDIDAILLTHAHIDHSGGIPLFYISNSPPLFATQLTLDIVKILARDMIKISGDRLPFEAPELRKMLASARPVNYESRIRIAKDAYATFYNAGHIPGSAQILIEMDNKRILYTGDINATETRLVAPMHQKFPPVDAVITESSYALNTHAPRKDIERKFIDNVTNTLSNKGRVLVPAFGVARSQEILCLLEKYGVNAPVFIDGMARSVTRLFLNYPLFFGDFKTLSRAAKKAYFVGEKRRAYEDRKMVIKKEGAVIIAPSGMMKGGTVRYYSKYVLPDPRSAVFLVSYQVENTPGRILLEEGYYIDDEGDVPKKLDIGAQVDFYDFSAHSGREQLLDFVTKQEYRGDKTAFCIHGEEAACTNFAKTLTNDHEFLAFAPETGDSFLV